MKHPIIRRIAVIFPVLVLLLTVFPATPALADGFAVSVAPNKGKVGSYAEAFGYGFSQGSPIRVYFASTAAGLDDHIGTDVRTYKLVDTVNATGTQGEVEAYFQIPSELLDGTIDETVQSGTYYIYLSYTNRLIKAYTSFTIEAVASATISPSSGTVGDSVTVSGAAFAASETITITFSGVEVATTASDSSGGFSASFIVADNTGGGHQITVSDGTTTRTDTFTIAPSASFSPASGSVGTEVSISGRGFGASQTISLTFDGTELATASSDSKGSFTAVVAITDHATGSYQLIASDGTNAGSSSFTIEPSTSISQASGFVGDEVAITGTGFTASVSLPILFDKDLTETVNTNSNGTFSGTFSVPNLDADTYIVEVSNPVATGTKLIKAGDFKISTSTVIDPITTVDDPGHLGSQVTIDGIGFTAGGTVTVSYDSVDMDTDTVKSDGTFQLTFAVTTGSSGEHTIIVSDAVNTSRFKFFMEAKPPLAPVPLIPQMGVEAEAETIFDWQDVTDLSGVTYLLQVATSEDFSLASIVIEKKGLILSGYTLTDLESLPALENEAPYYWHVRAIDGVSNQSPWTGTGTFLIKGFALNMPQPLIYTLFGVGALLLFVVGIWLGRKTAYY